MRKEKSSLGCDWLWIYFQLLKLRNIFIYLVWIESKYWYFCFLELFLATIMKKNWPNNVILVATPISRAAIKKLHRTLNVSGQNYGYIVSHDRYGTSSYPSNINSSLTLTGLQSNKVELIFQNFTLQKKQNGICLDYLLISGINKICEPPASNIVVDLGSSVNQITFSFFTDGRQRAAGFWLSYRGRC